MLLLQPSALLCSCFQICCLGISNSTQRNPMSAHVERTLNMHHRMLRTRKLVKKILHTIYICYQRAETCTSHCSLHLIFDLMSSNEGFLHQSVYVLCEGFHSSVEKQGDESFNLPQGQKEQSIFWDSCCKSYQLIVRTHPTVKQKPIYTNSWWEQYSFHFYDWIYS